MLVLLLAAILVTAGASSDKPDMLVNISSNITLNTNQSFSLQEMLLKTPGEYLEQGVLNVTFNLTQLAPYQYFDMLAFDLNNDEDSVQYANYVASGSSSVICAGSSKSCNSQCIQDLMNFSVSSTVNCCSNCSS